MTAPAFSPEVVAGARAMRDTKRKLIYERTYALGHGLGEDEIFQIDCQALAAGLRVLLETGDLSPSDVYGRDFIRRITSGSAQHGTL